MIPSERRDFIYRHVHEYQLVTIVALAELMSVSHMTVRRDIHQLEEEGKVISVSGGVRLSDALRQELAYKEKAQLHHRQKRAIGKYAAAMVEDGQVVYLDAGTTSFEIARHLAERFNLTVVTNDFPLSST
jgi:DeoR/GlpR family transcriptional regulator of sugar metabolism